MNTESQRTCPSCGNEFSGGMEFCPVCIFRKAVADGVQSGESSTEDTLKATPEQGVKRNAYAAPSAKAPSERELAAGVLKQAAYELRRFHGATTAVERELYQDAYSWVMSDDSTWPFSFLNVCRLFCSSTAWPHLISVRP